MLRLWGLVCATALALGSETYCATMWEAGELNYSDTESEVSAFINTERNTQLQTVLCARNSGYSYRFTLLLPKTCDNDMVIQVGVKSDTLKSTVYAEVSGNSLEFQIDQQLIISLKDSPVLEFEFSKSDADFLGLPELLSVPMTGSDLIMRKVASECTALCLTKDFSCDRQLLSSILWPNGGFSKTPVRDDLDTLCTQFKNDRFSFVPNAACKFALDRFYQRYGVGPLSFLDAVFNKNGSHFEKYTKLWNEAVGLIPGGTLSPGTVADAREWYLMLYALSGDRRIKQFPQSYYDILRYEGDPTTVLYDTDNRYELEELKYTSVLSRRAQGSLKALDTIQEALKEWAEFYRDFSQALPQAKEAQALRPLIYRSMLLRIWYLAGQPEGVVLRQKNAFVQGTGGKLSTKERLESLCSFFDGEGGNEYFYGSSDCIRGVFADLSSGGFATPLFSELTDKWDAFAKAWTDSDFYTDSVDDAAGPEFRSKLTLPLLTFYRIYGFGDYFLMRQCIASRDPDICSYEASRFARSAAQELQTRQDSIAKVSPNDAQKLGKLSELWKDYFDALDRYTADLEKSGTIPRWRVELVKGMAAVEQMNALLNLSYDHEELPDETLENVD